MLMMHVPIRGLFFLGRAAVVAVAVAAVPVVVKASKPLAKRVGEELEKLAKWLQEDAGPIADKPTEKPAPTANVARGNATKSEAKKPAPRRRTAKSKPQAKKPAPKGESA